jgi:hypothetical protein
MFARQMQAMGSAPQVDIHDVMGNDDHVVSIGTAKANGPDGSNAAWKWVQVFHMKDGKATEVWASRRTTPPWIRSWTTCQAEPGE